MSRARYIGDEAHAAAWRLAGIETATVADRESVASVLDEARRSADLVLLAPALQPALTVGDRRTLAPLVLALPDMATRAQPSELAQRVRRLLGMDA